MHDIIIIIIIIISITCDANYKETMTFHLWLSTNHSIQED